MKVYRKAPLKPRNPACSWSIHTRKGVATQQKAREKNGRPNREQAAINSEIAGDKDFKRPAKPDDTTIDKARLNAEVKRHQLASIHDMIRARFGPRLVRHDGSALYRFQCKKTA